MAGKIAHDFNNILMGIMGNLSLAMLNTGEDNKTYKYLEQTEQAVLRARGLTNRLLTFSSGGAPVKKVVDIIELLRDSVQFVLRGTQVQWQYEHEPDIWPIELDQEQFNQAIQNIVMNAMQSMHQTGRLTVEVKNITLTASNHFQLVAGNYVLVAVRDTGDGIPSQNIYKIFDPYYTTKNNASGLGLAACYSIIRQHGGHITVESELGVGSVFSIYLPVSEILPESPPPFATEVSNTKNVRILIMDDEPLIRQTVSMVLQRFDYLVEVAADGAEAIEIYRRAAQRNEPFDLVIMDLTVPGGMGGKEAVKLLLDFDPEARVIVSSGYSDDPVMAYYTDYGFKGVVAKPYALKELLPVLEKVLV
jgi:CheY-like chemotaxis protein